MTKDQDIVQSASLHLFQNADGTYSIHIDADNDESEYQFARHVFKLIRRTANERNSLRQRLKVVPGYLKDEIVFEEVDGKFAHQPDVAAVGN
jgi:hypothetical protein